MAVIIQNVDSLRKQNEMETEKIAHNFINNHYKYEIMYFWRGGKQMEFMHCHNFIIFIHFIVYCERI